jgi:DNA-binding CsgD family transcriptional regulator
MQPCDRLTVKEVQVAMLVWEGQTNREIANVIGTTEQVIKNYLRNTFDKLGVWSRLELALYVAAHGGVQWREPAPLPPVPISSAESPHLLPEPQRANAPAGANLSAKKDDHRPSTLRSKSGGLPRLVSA